MYNVITGNNSAFIIFTGTRDACWTFINATGLDYVTLEQIS